MELKRTVTAAVKAGKAAGKGAATTGKVVGKSATVAGRAVGRAATSDVAKRAVRAARDAVLGSAGDMAMVIGSGDVGGKKAIKALVKTTARNVAKRSAQAALTEAGKAAHEAAKTNKAGAARTQDPVDAIQAELTRHGVEEAVPHVHARGLPSWRAAPATARLHEERREGEAMSLIPKRRPRGTCGQRLVPVVYGFPSASMIHAAERGKVVIGGCMLGGRRYACPAGHSRSDSE